jgi:hypothetical protein
MLPSSTSIRAKRLIKVVRAMLLAACLQICNSSPTTAQQTCSRLPEATDDELVVGLSGSQFIFATRGVGKGSTPCAPNWRCRTLLLPLEISQVVDFDLAPTGTKLAILSEDTSHKKNHKILDLSVSGNPVETPAHFLPHQTYHLYVAEHQIIAIDDHNREISDPKWCSSVAELPPELQRSFERAYPGNPSRWKSYLIKPDPRLYAPVLEFAHDETVFPTETSIWDRLAKQTQTQAIWQPVSKKTSLSNNEQALRDSLSGYLAIPDSQKRALGKVYYRVCSYQGSWLFEYWTYYAFDVGHVRSHPHDTEHIFVEVDKIGGRVVGVLGAAHSSLTPNNLYSALKPDAEPTKLPIFAIVEKGKHSLAPDVNQDGRFTPGIDVNIFSENSQIWGIRDAIGQSDSHMRAYEASMTLGRSLDDVWAVADFDEYFEQSSFPHIQGVYRLVQFPQPVIGIKNAPTQAEADHLLNEHPDSLQPTRIYKPWVFPFRFVRLGYGSIDYNRLLTIGYVSELQRLPGLSRLFRVPLPGRIDLEAMIGRSATQDVPEQGYNYVTGAICSTCLVPVLVQTGRVFHYTDSTVLYGVQYERPSTNLFGYFGAYFREYDRFGRPEITGPQVIVPDVPLPTSPIQQPTTVGQFGLFVEMPRLRNLTLHFGPVFTNPGPGTGIFARVSFSIWRSRGRSKFGDPSP